MLSLVEFYSWNICGSPSSPDFPFWPRRRKCSVAHTQSNVRIRTRNAPVSILSITPLASLILHQFSHWVWNSPSLGMRFQHDVHKYCRRVNKYGWYTTGFFIIEIYNRGEAPSQDLNVALLCLLLLPVPKCIEDVHQLGIVDQRPSQTDRQTIRVWGSGQCSVYRTSSIFLSNSWLLLGFLDCDCPTVLGLELFFLLLFYTNM